MAQVLIVEGKDGIFLANLCRLKGLPAPAGYETPQKFMDEKSGFIKQGEGWDKALRTFREYLDNPAYERIGIILDANETGPENRSRQIEAVIREKFPDWKGRVKLSDNGFVSEDDELPLIIGIWIMPDNRSNGYLEHFIAELIPEGDTLWDYAQTIVGELPDRRFPAAREQKALLHTWLAWQETPGLPFGTALSSGILTPESPLAGRFIEWFQRTFELAGR